MTEQNYLRKFRVDYSLAELNLATSDKNPFVQFSHWFQQAAEVQPIEPNAMMIATATPEGSPSARVVLLKAYDEQGFVFFTNYESQKGQELTANPQVAALFYWDHLQRQVRITGAVEKISREASEEYFHSRPRDAQIGAWTSQQSKSIVDRSVLDERKNHFATKFAEQEIPLPDFWGGYKILPAQFEFWQGRKNRLHDRIRYTKNGKNKWLRERLSP